MRSPAADAVVAASQETWQTVRRYLNAHRYELTRQAAALYQDRPTVRGLLMPPGWTPARPVPLDDVGLAWLSAAPTVQVDGTEGESASVRPWKSGDQRYVSYSEAMGALAQPSVFENRPCYRLVDVVANSSRPRLTFTRGTFFDTVDVCEATAHELAQATREGLSSTARDGALPFRSLVGDPTDLHRRRVIPAISVLTIRRSKDGDSTFLLHRRDSGKVAHGGGLHQVVPVGVFQPTGPEPWNERNDFDLLRSIGREYSEELLGEPERAGTGGPIDYDAWPFFRSLTGARSTGDVCLFWLGLGVDPLSFVADLLVVAVFEAELFDRLFHDLVAVNAEGTVVAQHGSPQAGAGVPFTEEVVRHYVERQPMQAAGAALLHLASEQREAILA